MTLPNILRSQANLKLGALFKQIDEIRAGEFPYSHGRDALVALRQHLQQSRDQLTTNLPADADISVVKQQCSRVNRQVTWFLPLLGFILRSTNVRNSFEFFDPLLRLARSLVGDDAKLILSSEWDYSPMTYPMTVQELPNFVLIGLPASESENALIVPLAGHELGHSVWAKREIETAIKPKLFDNLRDSFLEHWPTMQSVFGQKIEKEKIDEDLEVYSYLSLSLDFALSQSQEIFCDLMGLRIFGVSFLHAFRYLLSPQLGGRRSTDYPNLSDRAKLLVAAAAELKIPCPPNFVESFDAEASSKNTKERFLTDMADLASQKMLAELMAQCASVVAESKVQLPDSSKQNEIEASFALGVPSDGNYNLADIVNAGWVVIENKKWNESASPDARFSVLNEMIFKSIEVSEYCLLTR